MLAQLRGHRPKSTGGPPKEAFLLSRAVKEDPIEEDPISPAESQPQEAEEMETSQAGGEVTTETPTECSSIPATEEEEAEQKQPDDKDHESDDKLQAGDHVYQWCSLLGIPGIFQHHGIVLHAEDMVGQDGEMEQLLTIADFSNLLLNSSTTEEEAENGVPGEEKNGMHGDYGTEIVFSEDDESISICEPADKPTTKPPTGSRPFFRSGAQDKALPAKVGCLRVYRTQSKSKSKHKWHKVQYQDNWFHTHLWKRSGTCTPTASDPPEMVLRRVQLLLSHSTPNQALDNETTEELLLPPYHSIYSNCECMAVWCKTGIWSTLQAASFLSHAAVGQVKGTATIAGIAAAQTVAVPAAGVWGWLGYTTAVPLMSVQPLILPAICAYGAIMVGGPAVCLAVAKKKWKGTTDRLNQALEVESTEVSLVS